MSDGKNSRRSARELAFQCLYGLAFVPAGSEGELRERLRLLPSATDAAAGDEGGFAWELVFGVWSRIRELDGVIARLARNWRPDRMGRVELTLLRLAVYELRCREDVPVGAAINEALELSRRFGDDGARSFINGILDAAARERPEPDEPRRESAAQAEYEG
jgi:N utilization substance protein B